MKFMQDASLGRIPPAKDILAHWPLPAMRGGKHMMTKCYDFFRCQKSKCVMFVEEAQGECWMVEGALTYCLGLEANEVGKEEGILFCKNCLYYEHMQKNMEGSA